VGPKAVSGYASERLTMDDGLSVWMLLGETGALIVSEGAGTAATKVEAKHRIAVEMVNFIIVCDKQLEPKKDIVVYI
jgi:hypothetical protein